MPSLISTRFPSARRRNARRLGFDPLESRALLTAGVLDPTFGTAGIVTSAGLDGNNVAPYAATALYPQTDAGDPTDAGKVVVAGTYNTGSKDDFAVIRSNPNGTLDTSFGGTGEVITSLTAYGDDAHAVAIQPNGKIIVGGLATITSSGESVFALVRYNTNGTLDTSFGTGGLVTTAFTLPKGNVPYDSIWSVALEPNGEILAAGLGSAVINGSSLSAATLALYQANGKLDTTFGTGGVVSTALGSGGSGFPARCWTSDRQRDDRDRRGRGILELGELRDSLQHEREPRHILRDQGHCDRPEYVGHLRGDPA